MRYVLLTLTNCAFESGDPLDPVKASSYTNHANGKALVLLYQRKVVKSDSLSNSDAFGAPSCLLFE